MINRQDSQNQYESPNIKIFGGMLGWKDLSYPPVLLGLCIRNAVWLSSFIKKNPCNSRLRQTHILTLTAAAFMAVECGKIPYSMYRYSQIFERGVSSKDVGLLLEAPDAVSLHNTVSVGHSLQNSGLHVVRKEVHSSKDVNVAIEEIVKSGNRIRAIVVNGHGNEREICLREGYVTQGSDLPSLKHLQPGSKIILQSCRTGRGKESIAARICNHMTVPNIEVIAPQEDCYPNGGIFYINDGLKIQGNNQSLHVQFRRNPLLFPIKFWTHGTDYTARYSTGGEK